MADVNQPFIISSFSYIEQDSISDGILLWFVIILITVKQNYEHVMFW